MNDNLDALLAIQQTGNGGRRAVRAVVAGVALVGLGLAGGISAVVSGRTFAEDQLSPVKARVESVEQKQAATEADLREHKAKQEERERALFETLRELKAGQEQLVKSVQEVKERCVEGGGCSERRRRDR